MTFHCFKNKFKKTYPINHISWNPSQFLDSAEFPNHVSIYVGTGVVLVQVTQISCQFCRCDPPGCSWFLLQIASSESDRLEILGTGELRTGLRENHVCIRKKWWIQSECSVIQIVCFAGLLRYLDFGEMKM